MEDSENPVSSPLMFSYVAFLTLNRIMRGFFLFTFKMCLRSMDEFSWHFSLFVRVQSEVKWDSNLWISSQKCCYVSLFGLESISYIIVIVLHMIFIKHPEMSMIIKDLLYESGLSCPRLWIHSFLSKYIFFLSRRIMMNF